MEIFGWLSVDNVVILITNLGLPFSVLAGSREAAARHQVLPSGGPSLPMPALFSYASRLSQGGQQRPHIAACERTGHLIVSVGAELWRGVPGAGCPGNLHVQEPGV